MVNPGLAKPRSNELFRMLSTSEYTTDSVVPVNSDPTMSIVINFIKKAYKKNNIKLPHRYTIYIENLFNIKEETSRIAKQLAIELTDEKHIMFQHKELNETYKFIWFAWGNTDIESNRQKLLISKFPNAIAVHKMNCRNNIIQISYPKHPIGMSKKYFKEAALGKVIP